MFHVSNIAGVHALHRMSACAAEGEALHLSSTNTGGTLACMLAGQKRQ
jgi:hypothetical protein